VSDADVLNVAFDTIARKGFESFTFSQVGKAVGLSPAALVKRFKSKKRLASLSRAERWERNLRQMDRQPDGFSGLKGVFDFLALIARSVDSKRLGEHARLLGTEANEQRSKKRVAAYFAATRRIFARLLREAVNDRELDGERLVPEAYAATLEALVQGAIFQFAFLEEDDLERHLHGHVRTILQPYASGDVLCLSTLPLEVMNPCRRRC
jgi:AcrR family transcriptional regulator